MGLEHSLRGLTFQTLLGGGGGATDPAEKTGLYHDIPLTKSCMPLKPCRWEPSCVLYIADMCKDINMTSEELEFLIQKVLR